MARRALAASLLGAALLGGGLAPLTGTAGASSCVAFGDAKGDAKYSPDPSVPSVDSDDDLDMTGVAAGVVGGKLTFRITVAKLGTKAAKHTGDYFETDFMVNGKRVNVFATRYDPAALGTVHGQAFAQNGLSVDGSYKSAYPVGAAYDPAANTVTLTVAKSDLDKAVGGSGPAEAIGVTSSAVDSALLTPYDTAYADEAVLDTDSACTLPSTVPAPAAPLPVVVDSAVPAPGCHSFTDLKGDGYVSLANLNGTNAGTTNEPGLDITEVTFRTTPRALLAYVAVDKLETTTKEGNGPRFEWNFSLGGKAVTIYAQKPDSTWTTVREKTTQALIAPSTEGGRFASAEDPRLKVTTAWDTAHNIVRLGVATSTLEAVTGVKTAGASLTAVSVASKILTLSGTLSADSAAGTPATYAVGDSRCFGPAPGVLTNAGATTVQYTDAATVGAKLTDAAGHALAGRTVTFAVGSARVTARTGTDGVAKAALNPNAVAGTYTLVTSFAGDTEAAEVSTSTPFTVTVERTALSLSVVKSGSKRTVTARLLDDDRKPVAGQTITWYVDGKRAGTSVTNASGLATLKTAKPTQLVRADFAAVAGKYAGSTTQRKV